MIAETPLEALTEIQRRGRVRVMIEGVVHEIRISAHDFPEATDSWCLSLYAVELLLKSGTR